MRIKRLFNNIKLLDRNLEIKISPETQNFVKQWIAIQKDEWRKKLSCIYVCYIAPNMNQAKEYDTIELYFQRDDKQYRQRIEETLRQVNVTC